MSYAELTCESIPMIMEAKVKEYSGVPEINGRGAEVFVRYQGGGRVLLAHHVQHNRDGILWGAAGSVDLARSILLDSFGVVTCPDYPNDCTCSNVWVEPHYKEFNKEIVSQFSSEQAWKLQQFDIADWVFDHASDESPIVDETLALETV